MRGEAPSGIPAEASGARASRDSIHDVWGPRTPYLGSWPARVDERSVAEADRTRPNEWTFKPKRMRPSCWSPTDALLSRSTATASISTSRSMALRRSAQALIVTGRRLHEISTSARERASTKKGSVDAS